VSRLSNRRIELSLGARTIQASLHTTWPRRKLLAQAQHALPITPQEAMPSHQDGLQPACAAGIQTVLTEITALAAARHAALHVRMGDAHMCFDVVKGDYANASDRELQAIATACVQDTLGERASTQLVRWQLQPDHEHLLIASLPSPAVETLANIAAEHGWPLASVQPWFCERWNDRSKAKADDHGLFASVGAGNVVMVLSQRGSIVALSATALGVDASDTTSDSPTRSALDLCSERLLSSVGVHAESVSSWLLDTPEEEAIALPPRWSHASLKGIPA
jgi:hypothetical protein